MAVPLQSSMGAQGPAGPQGPAPAPAPTLTLGGGAQANQGVINELGQAPQVPTAPPTPIGPTPQQLAAGMAYGQAVTQPPSFMTPAMQQYINQFQQSQGAQQQAMNSGLLAALQGLGARRDAAANVVATLPGQYQQAYKQATASQQAAAKNAGFGHATIGGNADQALITAANTQEAAAGKANQPLLQAGITADASQGQTALANTNMENQAALAQQGQAFDQQMAMAQAQWQQQQQAQQSGYAHDIAMAQLQSTLGTQQYKAENPNAALTPAQQEQEANQQSLDALAIKNGFTSYQQQQQVESDPTYTWALQIVQGTNGRGSSAPGASQYGSGMPAAGDKAGLVKYLSSANGQLILKALVANGYLTAADINSAG